MPVEYSRRSPAVKRLMKEAQELKEPTEQYFAQPLEENLFEWHFTVRGPPDSDFANGVYHGRITLPPEYPMKPPSIMLLTSTGRFEVGTKICLSISGHHPETWQPSWSIRTVLLAIIGFMPTKGEGAIGSLDYTSDERKVLARRSQDWKCETCGTPNRSILPPVTSKSDAVQKEAAEIAAQIQFKKEEKKTAPSTSPASSTSPPPVAPANNQPAPAPAPIPPNIFNMWNQQQGGMMPPFNMPLPPNFMIPGQGQARAGPANLNPQTPVGQTVPVSRRDEGASSNIATGGGSLPANESQADPARDQPESLGATAPGGAGLRQRTSAASRTNTDTTATRVPATSANVTAAPPQAVVRHSSQSILCPLVTISIFSLIIIMLIFRRIYITYSYKFT